MAAQPCGMAPPISHRTAGFSLIVNIRSTNPPAVQELNYRSWTSRPALANPSILYSRGGFEATFGGGESIWEGASGLWLVDATTGAKSEFIPTMAGNPLVGPSFSPDGNWVSYYELTYIEGRGEFRTWNAETGATYTWDGIEVGGVSWAPDSATIAFDEVTYIANEGVGIYLGLPDGSHVSRLYGDPAYAAMAPIFSPDGEILLVLLQKSFGEPWESKYILVDLDGSELHSFQTNENATGLNWAPDNSSILFFQPLYDSASGPFTADWGRTP